MAEYRNRTTGEINTQGELRKKHSNMSLPKTWNDNVLDALNVDKVYSSAQPTEGVGQYQKTVESGVEQAENGNWQKTWAIVDMFVDDDELGTKAEQEAAYQNTLDDKAAKRNRNERDLMIAETDWWAMSDTPDMTSAQTTYRQALRDITTHSNWPHLEADDWPTKP